MSVAIDIDRGTSARALENEVTEEARRRDLAAGKDLKWIRSMFSIREGRATHGDDGKVRRRHLPMQIDDAIAWARRGEGEQIGLPLSCGEWGFCG